MIIGHQSPPKPTKDEEVRRLNNLYASFKIEFDSTLFETQNFSDHSLYSLHRKETIKEELSDHATPDDEEEYLAIKRRKLKGKILRKTSHSPTNGGFQETALNKKKDDFPKFYKSPYSVKNTSKSTSTVIRRPKMMAESPSKRLAPDTMHSKGKNLSKRLKGMSLLRIRNQFHTSEHNSGSSTENNYLDDFQEQLDNMPSEAENIRITEWRASPIAKSRNRNRSDSGTNIATKKHKQLRPIK